MVLPYYLMRFEAKAEVISGSNEQTNEFLEDCNRLRQMLDEKVFDDNKSLYTNLIKFINKVADHIFRNEIRLKKGVERTMNGKILMLESERLLKKGEKKGGNLMIYSLVEDRTITPEQGAKKLKISVDELKKKMALTEYKYPE